MAACPRRTNWSKHLRLACWNAEGVRGRKLELEHFLNQRGVDICLLSETFFIRGKPSGLPTMSATAQTDQQLGGGTDILVRCGLVHHSVPVPGLPHLQATAVQIMLAGRPVKVLAAYHSPSRPMFGEDLDA
jgi:hypothetical protein